ncbi:hypothetical protein FQN54_001764 [Arachnomyces sp. PD_36]|nr:hypothetical protein FQN54_001764 [Arachnomyces sp. PD_36]
MPPRIPIQPYTKACNGYPTLRTQRPSINPCTCPSRSSSSLEAAQRRKHDPYSIAQSRQRKAANISRQQVLREQRAAAVGDPVRSANTPFIASLQGAPGAGKAQAKSEGEGEGTGGKQKHTAAHLNYFVSAEELEKSLEYSKNLTAPVKSSQSNIGGMDPMLRFEEEERHEMQHEKAQEAVKRILQLSNGNSKDRSRINIQRCIETFGRHNTDSTLDPKPAAVPHSSATAHAEKAPRAGPDTGSPEVQAAILTSKIQVLAKQLETTGHKDKHNKKNLRLLVHRRQKLLRYLRKKERGGPRWVNLMENLGLAEGAWKGEISI